jgi:hypothetical protein
VLFQDADNVDSANHQVHSWSANFAVGLIILAVVFAALQARREGAKKWERLYGLLAATMVLVAVVIKAATRPTSSRAGIGSTNTPRSWWKRS